MDISTKMTLSFDLKDTTTMIKAAAVQLLKDNYGMIVTPNELDVKFNTRHAGIDSNDTVSQVISGIEVTITKAPPK